VNEVERGLLPQGLKDLKRVARHVGLDLTRAVLHLEAGFDSKATRKAVFHAGLMPHLKENPRNRQTPKRGRKRFFDEVMKCCTNCASPLNAPSPGRINANASCGALRPNRIIIWGSNSLLSRSSISGSFVEAETCNQFT
jgi:hypothetical protein